MYRDLLMIAISIIHIRYLCCIYDKNTRLHEFKMIAVIQTSFTSVCIDVSPYKHKKNRCLRPREMGIFIRKIRLFCVWA